MTGVPNEQIARIAAAQMGEAPPPPGQPPAPPPGQPMPGQPPAPPPGPAPSSANTPPSPMEQAVSAAAPKGEDELQAEDAVMYEVEMGEGQKRKLSPAQIKSTFERYAALNQRHANMKPVLQMAEALAAQSGAPPDQLANFMVSAMKAYQSNPTMGKGSENAPPQGQQQSGDDPLAAWETENAASLPPGYRDLHKNMQQMTSNMAKQQEMLMAVLQAAKGNAQQGQQAQQGAQATRADALRQQVANNLDTVQNRLGLPDEAAEDFMAYALERGYTPEDFVDGDMTMRVMTDFKNTQQSPEMDRLRAMAQRRAAYTGSLGSSAAPPAGAAPDADPTFDRLASAAMANVRR